jgi:hypothetical protein
MKRVLQQLKTIEANLTDEQIAAIKRALDEVVL